jgi:hypothetical protein
MRTKLFATGGALVGAAILGLTSIGGSLDVGALGNDSNHPPHTGRPAAAPTVNPLVQLDQAATLKQWVDTAFWTQIRQAYVAQARQKGVGRGCAPEDFACFRACTIERETHGTYGGVSKNGQYHGAWQFDQRTWDSNAAASGRTDLVGVPPEQATPSDQDAVAYDTYSRRGKSPWGGRC